MKRINLFLVVILVLGIFGCATNNKIICNKPGMTESEFKKDNYECVQQSRTSWSGGGSGLIGIAMIAGSQSSANEQARNLYKMCMEARGYTTEEVSQEEFEKRKADNLKRVIIGIRFGAGTNNPSAPPIVDNLIPNSPAEKAGIRAGDTIIERDDVKVNTIRDLSLLPKQEVGKEYKYKILRGNEILEFNIKGVLASDLVQNK